MCALREDSRSQASRSPVAEVVSPAPRQEWLAVLATDPGASVFQTPSWFEAAAAVTGARDVSRLYLTRDGRRLVLPLLRRRPLPAFSLDDGLPHPFGPGGLLATGGVRPSDVQLVLSDLGRSPALSTRVTAMFDVAEKFEAGLPVGATATRLRVHVLDLEGGFATVWAQRFHPSARKAVRRAERAGLTVERDTTGRLVPAFYELYLAWTAERTNRSGLPVPVASALARRRQPLAVFEALTGPPLLDCRTWLASHEGTPVAGLVTFVHGAHAISFRSYSLREHRALNASHLLKRLAIEDACADGCRWFNLGMSGGVSGLEAFKESLGATPRWAVDCRVERVPVQRLQRGRDRAASSAAAALTRLRGDTGD
ncbi:GNAT family N-acetyltransferase [Oryzihumus sp.]|uniref:GNAT family N-acetyltransferase n=1 Tax=Oryzihumus sp. TaxID=1968903 RepID=UPI002ED876B2